jgi:hypothetical protein
MCLGGRKEGPRSDGLRISPEHVAMGQGLGRQRLRRDCGSSNGLLYQRERESFAETASLVSVRSAERTG